MKTLAEIGMIEIPESPKREQNLEREGDYSDSCICCGKRTKGKYYFNTVEGPDAIKADVTDEDLKELGLHSQGIMYVGPECRKRFPKGYIITNHI